ncbi:MAG: tyrosine recombinase XerC [Bacillota bacterium]|nr:tyrosine recombinase XerC [Bacillota bacterium]
MDGYPEILNDFLTHMETIRGKSQKTVDEYALDLRMFFRFMKIHRKLVSADTEFSDITIDDIDLDFVRTVTLSDIYSYLNYLGRDKKDKAATRARKVASLRSFFKFLTLKTHQLENNPTETLDAPKLRSSLPVYLSLEESLELLNTVDGPFKERDFCILILFLNCGMRLSELVGIDITDIKDDTLRVLGKGNKERTVYLNDACLDAIYKYLEIRPRDGVPADSKNALFLSKRKTRISPKTVQWLVKKYIESAGLDGKHYSTHKLRHTAATLMFRDGGVDVRTLQEILGHAQLTTTQIYTHVSDEQLKKAAMKNPLSKVTGAKIESRKNKK